MVVLLSTKGFGSELDAARFQAHQYRAVVPRSTVASCAQPEGQVIVSLVSRTTTSSNKISLVSCVPSVTVTSAPVEAATALCPRSCGAPAASCARAVISSWLMVAFEGIKELFRLKDERALTVELVM